ncbi:MAG: T9SS type A sorting domain-containing protein [Paludibacteraceae bacterium]
MKKVSLLIAVSIMIVFTTNAQWQSIGTAGFTPAGVDFPSLAFNSNDGPFVAYRDGLKSWKTTVMKFNGTNWVTVGTAGFSAAGSEYTSLAFNSSDEPYVAYRDAGNSKKATVMKFVDGTMGITDLNGINNTIAVYPNPTKNKINFSVQTNVQVTNVAGRIVDSKTSVNALDLSNYLTDFYFLTLIDKHGKVIQRSKVVKE